MIIITVVEFNINDNQFILDKDCKLYLNDIEINNNNYKFFGKLNYIKLF